MVELGITTVGVEECEYGTPASPQVGFAETDGPVGKDGDRDIVTITFGTGLCCGTAASQLPARRSVPAAGHGSKRLALYG